MARRKRQQRKRQQQKNGQRRAGRAQRPDVKLSVCMIAKDEAEFLAQCLESVRGLADEIVVGDTGSSDGTQEVARAAGARVLEVPWSGDFSEARNAVLREARGDWILVLDCDEVLAREDWKTVRKVAASGRADGYRMTTRNYLRESDRVGWRPCRGEYVEERDYPGWFPTTKVRLFRNHPRIRFEGALHELVEGSIAAYGGRVDDCLAPVHHYGYVEKDRAGEKVSIYLAAAERKAEKEPENPKAFFELAVSRRDAGNPEGAREAIERCLALLASQGGYSRQYMRREHALMVKADILGRLNDREGEEEAYLQALEVNPESYESLNNLGTLKLRAGDLAAARDCYERALALAPDAEVVRRNLEMVERAESCAPEPGKDRAAGRLSVCMIVKDGEETLARCLESVRPVADEIVVVDTGSADRSVEVARQYGAEVVPFAWRDDFAAARNESLERATGDWILWLDADEYLLPADLEKVGRAKGLERNQALLFTLVNEGADRSRFQQVKMFPNRPEVRFERPVHETVAPALKRLGLKLTGTDVEVRHTGYAEAGTAARKQQFYFELMEKWLERHPGDHDIRFRMGHTLYTAGRRGEARAYLEPIVAAGREAVRPDSVFRMASTFLGRCLLEDGDAGGAVPHLEAALEVRADDALAHLSLGEACRRLGRAEQAAGHLRRALDGWVDPNFPLDGREISDAARRLLEGVGGADAKQGRERLSLCMIVKNEEARLGRCLESVQGLVDEIVVVDTGSSDNTVGVAERFGAKIGYFEWCGDFSAARNASLKLATGDWILWLDADDILPGEYHGKIRDLLSRGRDRAYLFVLDSQGYETVSCLQMRLFPNLPGVQFKMPVHEQVAPSLHRLGVRPEPTDIRVVHTGYTTPEVVREKMKRYLGLMERWLETHPEDYVVRANVAMTHFVWRDLDRAIGHYEKILHESDCHKDGNRIIETTAWLYLGKCHIQQGDLEKGLSYILEARKLDDQYAVTNLTLGECYMKLGRTEDSLAALERAQAFEDQVTFTANDPKALKYWIRFFKGQNMEALDRPEDAARYYREAAGIYPARSDALGALSTVCRKLGRREEAVQALEEALRRDPEDARHRFNRGTFYLEEGNLAEADRWLNKALESDPDMPEVYLNMGIVARRRGDAKRAEEMYRQAVELDGEGYEPLANLAHLLLDQDRYAEAAEAFERVQDKKAGLLDVDLGLCAAYAHAGRVDAVRALTGGVLRAVYGGALQAALPEGVGARELAQLLAEAGRMLLQKQVLVCARLAYMAAHFLDPHSREAGLKLAEVFLTSGEVWRAVPVYEALIQAQPTEPELFRKLGRCYEALGVPEAVRLCSEQARTLEGRAG